MRNALIAFMVFAGVLCVVLILAAAVFDLGGPRDEVQP